MAIHTLVNKKRSLKRGEIVIDGQSLLNRRIVASSRPKIDSPERNMDIFNSVGRDGFIVMDHGTFGERKGEVAISVLCKSEEELEAKRTYLYELMNREVEIDFYNHPYGSFKGRVNSVELEDSKALGLNLKGKLLFKLQPYRRLHSNNTMSVSKRDIFRFDKGKLSFRLIITGSGGTYNITIGNESYAFTGVPQGVLVFDCVHKQTYLQESSTRIPMNHTKQNKKYPSYRSGDVVDWSGNITSVSIELVWEAI